jgi:hypothetical protein
MDILTASFALLDPGKSLLLAGLNVTDGKLSLFTFFLVIHFLNSTGEIKDNAPPEGR